MKILNYYVNIKLLLNYLTIIKILNYYKDIRLTITIINNCLYWVHDKLLDYDRVL